MNEEVAVSLRSFLQRCVSRRRLIRGAGAAAGAGFVAGSALWTSARAADEDEDQGHGLCGQPLPIPYTHPTPTGGPIHHYFPGPITGVAAPTDPLGAHPEGRDPSLITNFRGVVGEVDLRSAATPRTPRPAQGPSTPSTQIHVLWSGITSPRMNSFIVEPSPLFEWIASQ